MASLTFHFTEDISSYFKFAHDFKSGGFAIDITQGEHVTAWAPLFQDGPASPAAQVLANNPGMTKQGLIDALTAGGQVVTSDEAPVTLTVTDPSPVSQNIKFGMEEADVYELG